MVRSGRLGYVHWGRYPLVVMAAPPSGPVLPAMGMQENQPMATCEVCGNDYHLSFEIIAGGERHVFDSFECAIQRLAPICDHCGCRIIGHGIEANGTFFCCALCARSAGVQGVADHV